MGLEIDFRDQKYPAAVWKESDGDIGPTSFDTETTMMVGQEPPDYVIGSAFNGKQVFFIKRDDLKSFLQIHQNVALFMAYAPFDLDVVEKAGGPTAISLIESGGVLDVQLLGRLVDLAEIGELHASYSLDALAERILGVSLLKDGVDAHGNHIRTSFGQFRDAEGVIHYQKMPPSYLIYAGLDAIATYQIAGILLDRVERISRRDGVRFDQLLSHTIQLKASYALTQVTRNGLTIDQERRTAVLEELTHEMNEAEKFIRSHGWDGGVATLQAILSSLVEKEGISLPTTKTGRLSSKGDDLEEYRHIPFVEQYLKYTENKKLTEFLGQSGDRIHARFNPIVATGRTSSYSPNVQNFPRNSKIRSTIKAAPGHVLLDIDYSQIELRALAQITYRKFGFSRMLELLNEGVDLHSYFASVITKKPVHEVTDEERRKAKAVNFGYPGGLGARSFVQYANATYNVIFTVEEAEAVRKHWLTTFPEVQRYLEHDDKQVILDSGVLASHPHGASEDVAYWVIRGILIGQTQTKSSGRRYTEDEIAWAFDLAESRCFSHQKKTLAAIEQRKGSWFLWQSFSQSFNAIKFDSGRIRSNVGFCQMKNNPFQGLAADGAKEALYELIRSGYRVVNFIHDEFIVELPLESDLRMHEKEIRRILIESMRKHIPDVPIEVESGWMFNWNKKGTHKLDAEKGVLCEIYL